MLTTEPLDTIPSMPPSSTPPLPSTGEPDAAAAPYSTAETDSVIEPQSVLEIQPTDETHSIIKPPPLVATTLTTGTRFSTVVTLSIAAPTQTTEPSPIVTQPSTTVTSTIVVSFGDRLLAFGCRVGAVYYVVLERCTGACY